MSRSPTRPTPPRRTKTSRWVYALSALVAAGVAPATVYAQTAMKKVVHVADPNAPTTVQAEQIGGRPDREITLDRNAEVVQDQTTLTSDTACFKQVEDEVDAEGNVHMTRFGDKYTGTKLQLNLESGKGYLLDPTYKFVLGNGQGKADRVDFVNEEQANVVNGTYSTCEGPNPDWYLKSSTLSLDTGRDEGVGDNAVVYFKNWPILGTPTMSFSLSGARRSGWLAPTPGYTSTGGFELLVPYYFNIAPNRDLTLYPKLISKRGVQMGADARYMGITDSGYKYAGETYLEFLAHDEQTHTNRWLVKSKDTTGFAPGWTYSWDLNGESDNNYPNDFGKTVAASADRQLVREFRTDYKGEFWTLTARAQKYQVLQDPDAVNDPSLLVARPYDRLPAINLHAARYDVGGFDWALDAEVTRFYHPTLINGDRVVVAPQISYPFIQPGYYITPKVMMNLSSYHLNDDAITAASTYAANRDPSRAVPTFSLDSGMVFERPTTIQGKDFTQTLEPRLFYVYTPYRNQNDIPVFDTAAATFNMTQLFTENRFSGSDRIGDANQMTAALTSRFLDANGGERLRFTFGQRFYFADQQVQLLPGAPVTDSRSDLLLAANGVISPTWNFDSAIEYDQGSRQVESQNYSLHWIPGAKKVLNIAYTYTRGSFSNVEVSSQWPLTERLYGVGRINYSELDHRTLESLVGLEYKGDCWVFRAGVQRFVTTANNVSTPIFFQLELNGLSGFGIGNPLDTLKKTIGGYQSLNPEYNR